MIFDRVTNFLAVFFGILFSLHMVSSGNSPFQHHIFINQLQTPYIHHPFMTDLTVYFFHCVIAACTTLVIKVYGTKGLIKLKKWKKSKSAPKHPRTK